MKLDYAIFSSILPLATTSSSSLNATCTVAPGGIQINVNLLATFLAVLMAVGVNLLYAVGRLKLTNVEKQRRITAEMKAFRSEMSAAMKEGNKQKIEKLKKKQQQMQKMQMEASMENFKPTLLFAIPLFGVYFLVNNYFITGLLHTCIIAVSPIALPWPLFGSQMTFFWWYFICSFTFSTIITRLFGLTFD